MEVKSIQDYYEQIYDLYPTVKKSDIKRILMYGWKQYHLFNSYGADILITRRGFWGYCGSLTKDSVRYFNYYKRKMAVKAKVLYIKFKVKWDGYYYFALSHNQYENYLKQKNKRGRPKKNFTFEKVKLYKIYDECSLIESSKVAIFKIPYISDVGFYSYKDTFTTDKAELILEREPLKFKDILITNYNYQFNNLKLRNNEK